MRYINRPTSQPSGRDYIVERPGAGGLNNLPPRGRADTKQKFVLNIIARKHSKVTNGSAYHNSPRFSLFPSTFWYMNEVSNFFGAGSGSNVCLMKYSIAYCGGTIGDILARRHVPTLR